MFTSPLEQFNNTRIFFKNKKFFSSIEQGNLDNIHDWFIFFFDNGVFNLQYINLETFLQNLTSPLFKNNVLSDNFFTNYVKTDNFSFLSFEGDFIIALSFQFLQYCFFSYLILILFFFGTYKKALLSKFLWAICEVTALILKTNGRVMHYGFHLVFVACFFWLFMANIMSLIPYSFALTAQAAESFLFGCFFFLALNTYALFYKGLSFFDLFFPQGAPLYLGPLLVFIEFVSYWARAFSIGIRLLSNILAGHVLLKIASVVFFLLLSFFLSLELDFLTNIGAIGIISYIWKIIIFNFFLIILILSFVLIILINILELLVSILQSYVFVVLFSLYYKDALTGH